MLEMPTEASLSTACLITTQSSQPERNRFESVHFYSFKPQHLG